MRTIFDTVVAVSAPRRAIPTAAVAVALLAAEWGVGGMTAAIPTAVLLAALGTVGVTSARLAFPLGRASDASLRDWILFAVTSPLIVFFFGYLLPRTLLPAHVTLVRDEFGLFVGVPLSWAATWALAQDIELGNRAELAEERSLELQREAERAQLLAIRTHLDPHFLFNTLNAIAEWCRDDAKVAERATLQLSGMLRTMLDGVETESWPLSRELSLVTDLLDLHRTRDPSRIRCEIEIAEATQSLPIPPMILLSLADNAVKHGPWAGHDGVIRLNAITQDETLQISLSNPGAFAGPREGGRGLAMVQKRLSAVYGDAASLTISSDGGRTEAKITAPTRIPSPKLERKPA